MKVKIGKVKIGRRVRKDLGDLSGLEASINKYGLLHPVVINQDRELVSGMRRLSACKNLGFKEVEVRVIETGSDLDKLLIEGDENLLRKEFSEFELERLVKKKSKLMSGNIFARSVSFLRGLLSSIGRFFKNLFSRNKD